MSIRSCLKYSARAGSGHRGFSLVEVMITTAITGFATLGIISLIYFNNLTQVRGEQLSAAILLAEEVMEESRRLPFSELEARRETVQPFSRTKRDASLTQQAVIEIKLWDELGNEIPNGPPAEAHSFIRIEVIVTFLPRSDQSTTVRLVSWLVP